MNLSRQEEESYLEEIKLRIISEISKIDKDILEYSAQIKENKEFLYENKADMDNFERYGMRQVIARGAISGENAVSLKFRLNKLLLSPYFGRVDFVEKRKNKYYPVYIGIHAFLDSKSKTNLIHDWRAPISSMYYDFELGLAHYKTPSGKISGEIKLKRQYKIFKGQLEFMLDSSLNIHDDILQKELSLTSDEKMKNIVATIQRDQNAIIRNEKSEALIIQGVAGSGKTSVALHRIAFLLYRFNEEISSEDILIISPNKVFSDYISGVLPELGEENIPEMSMEDLAFELLDKKIKFQSFYKQMQLLLESDDNSLKERIRFKSNHSFINKINEYLVHIENSVFEAADIWIKKCFVPGWFIDERFKSLHRMTMQQRMGQIVLDIEENVRIFYNYFLTTEEKTHIRKLLKDMLRVKTLRDYYKGFYDWLGRSEMYMPKGSLLEYSDVFPLVYLKLKLEGIRKFDKVKHLVIDEMQDYNIVQYYVISSVFSCKKTILGDSGQVVNPYSYSNSEDIKKAFPDADTVKLTKSYRSTWEIASFAQKIQKSTDLVAIKRYGLEPLVVEFKSDVDEIAYLKGVLNGFNNSDYKSLGIICKTDKQAKNIYAKIKNTAQNINLISEDSVSFINGINICPIYMAKGLEFDSVVVPDVSITNYCDDFDRKLLYIACTRAMHELIILSVGERSNLLPG